MINRLIQSKLEQYRRIFPVVALLGSRQCGKTTLAKTIQQSINNPIYLDLESLHDLNKLSDPELFFKLNHDKTICLDEIQRRPDIFQALRSFVDTNKINGQFLILGSASPDLLQQSSETLAGRIGYLELSPFLAEEILKNNENKLFDYWLQGGYPKSFLNNSENSLIWRNEFIKTYIERDIPQLGFKSSSSNLLRFLLMISHQQGQLINYSELGKSINLSYHSIQMYANIFEEAFICRSLKPYHGNLKKRLIKSPKYYIRDTGILHALLNIEDFNYLMGHPVYGSSWETLVIENIISKFPEWDYSFFRTASGNELDLVIDTGKKIITIECKANTAPKISRGYWQAVEDIKPDINYIVTPIDSSYPIKENHIVCGLLSVLEELNKY